MNYERKAPGALNIVGPGRVGCSIAAAASDSGVEVELLGRDFDLEQIGGCDVLICVPDSEIPGVARRIAEGGLLPRLLGHCSGATTLEPLAECQADGAFSLHPLQTVPDHDSDLRGCPAAIAGSSALAIEFAEDLAGRLGMSDFRVNEADRAVYHAAASIASNYLVTLEQTAADLLENIGVEDPRSVLSPLIERSFRNWQARGAEALTGPIARGDEATIACHRRALADRHSELLPLYDELATRTRDLTAAGESS